jgi:uncharacterized iron-regulated membrane protein
MHARSLVRKTAIALSTLWLAFSCRLVLAADPFGNTGLKDVGKEVYGSQADAEKAGNLTTLIGSLVKSAIGLLGIVFLILIVYAGYLWMTARGDEKVVTKAKDTLQRAIIGLIIVVAAYAITTFLFTRISGAATGSGGSGAGCTDCSDLE